MNAANKTKWAKVLTAIVGIIAMWQTKLTSPPYDAGTVIFWTGIMTYATLTLTIWKQYLSAEINNAAGRVTIVIAISATILGLIDLIPMFHFEPHKAQIIKAIISDTVATLSVLSSLIWPSDFQNDKMQELKQQ